MMQRFYSENSGSKRESDDDEGQCQMPHKREGGNVMVEKERELFFLREMWHAFVYNEVWAEGNNKYLYGLLIPHLEPTSTGRG